MIHLRTRFNWKPYLKIGSNLYQIFIIIQHSCNMQSSSSNPKNKLFSNLTPLLNNRAPFKQNWGDGSFYLDAAENIPILVVGAGGLGCEIVKNLALSGHRNIHLIDMDTIDFTNLNRQFMFRKKDVGFYKADAVAQLVKKRCPGVNITTKKYRVQQLSCAYYSQFPIIIGGLDNIEARKFLNYIVFQINEKEQETVCFYIDGATEGFDGQSLLVNPYNSSCYQCSLLEGLAEKPKVNICTLANSPRSPEHCIQYVMEILWQKKRPNQLRDNDNLQHMKWLYEKALERAKQFKIQGVTEMLTLGVAKNIIPAIASTNALIAAICTNQAFKILSGCNPSMNNYIFYKGGTSIGSETYAAQKLPNCKSCYMRQNRLEVLTLAVESKSTLETLLKQVKKIYQYVGKPFITYKGKYILNPGDQERYPTRVIATIQQLQAEGIIDKEVPIILYLTDKCLRDQLQVQLTLNKTCEKMVQA